MQEADVDTITRELVHQHPRARDVVEDLERTLRMLPDRGQWKVADTTPAVFLLAEGGPLYTVLLTDDGEVHATSRPIDGQKIVVRFEWGDPIHVRDTERWRRTHWTFGYDSQDEDALDRWLQLDGAVRVAPPGAIDRGEGLARAIAARAGWTVGVVEGEEVRRI